ncbi:MAG: type II toxin-antitoxin system Phd/YefM family antitoxin [Candidatus Binataceae bacterium]
MKTITATELRRNLNRILDRLALGGGEFAILRNSRVVARLTAAAVEQNALEAMADLHQTLREEAAAGWEADIHRQRFRDS